MDVGRLQTCFETLALEARELYLNKVIPTMERVPSALEFLRDYVAPNKPVVIKGAFDHWPALHRWTNDYLRAKIGENEVDVAVTPDGFADSVVGSRFVMPEERRMTFSQFLDIIECKTLSNGVFYVQKQNSNMTLQFKELLSEVEDEIQWATEAFGHGPDAVNFWMGDSKAVTSLHKDHYENLYCVIVGEKKFTLIPPTDQPFIPYENFRSGLYKENVEGHFEIVDDDTTGMVPWIPVDPLNPDIKKYPQFRFARPVEVTVKAGDMLYLPSLWYHHVRQTHGCIAVNYWYDMEFDIKYGYYKFVSSLLETKPS